MPVRVYRHTDAGAPAPSEAAGSLVALLDAVLVNGYGALPPAGWSKPFGATNEALYQQGAGSSGKFLYVKDASAWNVYHDGTSGLWAANGATGLASQTRRVPVDGTTLSYYPRILKPDAAGRWVVVANEKAFYLLTRRSGWRAWSLFFFGDTVPILDGPDAARAAILGGISYSNPQDATTEIPATSEFPAAFIQNGQASPAAWFMGPHDRPANGGAAASYQIVGGSRYILSAADYPPFRYRGVRGPVFVPTYLFQAYAAHFGNDAPSARDIPRAVVPGLWANLVRTPVDQSDWPLSRDDEEYVFTSGPLAGRTIRLFNFFGDGSAAPSVSFSSWGIETSDTWGN